MSRAVPPRLLAIGRWLRPGWRHGFGVALLAAILAPAAVPEPAELVSRSLLTRSGPAGPTLFTLMSPAQTGIVTENRYADPRMWGALYHEFEVGEIGTGVAIGDFDGDGRPDVFVVSKTESCRLFRNLGGFRFEDVTDSAGVGDRGPDALIWKQGATFADVNNDGRLDLYVCRFNAPNLLYVNQGDGTFREMGRAAGLDVHDASVMAAFGDYDRDGWLDVFVQTNILDSNQHANGQRNFLFRNQRDGTFANVTATAGITGEGQGHAAVWWDYDEDGWPDLYVGNDFRATDKLYRNQRDGTFANVIAQVVPYTPYSSMGADLGDINNDGHIDFFIADMAATTHEKDQRGMADSRSRTTEVPAEPDGALQYERNTLYLNTGAGRCAEAAHLAGLAATDWTWAPRFEDFDNDGRLDLFVTNGMDREATNVDLLNQQMAAQSAAERIRVMRDSPVLAETNLAFRNLGDLRFENTSAAWGLNQRTVSFGCATGDLDGDGDLDLVYANYQAGVSVLRNDGAQGHRLVIALRGTTSNRFGIGASVTVESALGRQVRSLTLARGVLSSSEPILHFGLGEDPVVQRLTVTWPSGRTQTWSSLAVDRRLTITEPAAETGPADEPRRSDQQFVEASALVGLAVSTREDPIDETATQRLLPFRLNQRGPALACADVNGDGYDDLVIGGTTRTPLRLMTGSPYGKFTERPTAASVSGAVDDGPILLFDAEANGTQAMLVTRGGNSLPAGSAEYQPQLFFNNGRGDFSLAPADALPPLTVSAGAAVAADFDRDGRLDVFVGGRLLPGQYPLTPPSALLQNVGGRFVDVTDRLAPALRAVGLVTSALWSDVDDDGWPDLLVALEWGPVRYFHNDQGQGFSEATNRAGFGAAGAGWWTSIVAADFNRDGLLDYVVGNAGLNTPYTASVAYPALLFHGDFRGDGEEPQLVEAYYEGERLLPRRSRRDLGAAIPSVLKRYPRTNAFARATLGEILGAVPLSAAEQVSAAELRSGVFLSQPDGVFRFSPLPRLAQIAPLQGMVAADLDADGLTDIYAVQNSYAPVPYIGRFAGGLSQLLRGNGRGGFEAVPVAESALLVPGDAKALVLLDFGQRGWPDLVATRNQDTTIVYRNRGLNGRRSLRVELHDRGGNARAIGGRVTIELTSGVRQTAELHCGSGYYSQSSPACFFGYPENDPPGRVIVRWPAGETSEFRIPPGARTVALSR